jgi:hypothetical protein
VSAVRTIFVVGFSALLFALSAPSMFVNPPTPYTGIHRNPNAPIETHSVAIDRGSPAYRAGVRTGDALGCLSTRDRERIFDVYAPYLAFTPDPISLCVLRHGASQNISFVPRELPPPGLMYGSFAIAALRLAVFAVFLFVGCALVMARPSPMTWILWAYGCGNLPFAAAQGMLLWMPAGLYATITAVAMVIINLAAPLLAIFALMVPDDGIPEGWRGYGIRIIAAVAVAYAAFSLFSTVGPDLQLGRDFVKSASIESIVEEAFTALTVFLVIARIATMQRQERARFGWAAFAIMFGIVCNVVRNEVPDNTISIAGGVLTVVMPVALMYAILRRHVIDVRFVISRGVVYGVITTLIVGIIGLVDWATSAYLSQVRVALAIDAAVTIVLGIALHRSYRLIEYGVDFLLFRKKHEAEAYLRRLARTLLRADREETVDLALTHDPCDKLDLTMAALFRSGVRYTLASVAGWKPSDVIAFERDHDLVRFLATERTRLDIRDLRRHVSAGFVASGTLPAVAIPIFRGDDLFAFALYGLHRDGTRLDPDELDALERLCETAAQAYMRIENVRYHAMLGSPLPA